MADALIIKNSLFSSHGNFRPASLFLNKLHVQTQALQFPDEHVERFRDSRREMGLTLYDGLVDLRSSLDIIGLGRQKLLEDIGRPVCLERPNFHFPEPLASELRLPAKRLLRN